MMSQPSPEEGTAPPAAPIQPPPPSLFVAPDHWPLISQGAEARLWKIPPGVDHPAQRPEVSGLAKERFAKRYRHPILDARLTKQRCRMEGRLLEKCRQAGLAVPKVWRVAPPVLYMEFLEGSTVRNLWQGWIQVDDSNGSQAGGERPEMMQRVAEVGRQMGEIVGILHNIGVIHGDLTTSNMMVGGDERQPPLCSGDTLEIFLIDFGLSKNSESAEERAVDLFVLERALSSTHPSLPDNFMDHVILPAYSKAAPKADVTLQRLEQVRSRGRKRECFG